MSIFSDKYLDDLIKRIRHNLTEKVDSCVMNMRPKVTTSIINVAGNLVAQYKFSNTVRIFIYKQNVMIKKGGIIVYSPKNNVFFLYREKPIKQMWRNILNRCKYSKNINHQKHYQEKGIHICEEWKNHSLSFIIWIVMFGNYYPRCWIDRIDNDKDYTPDNVRVGSPKDSGNNKTNSTCLKVDIPVTKTISLWSDITGIKYNVLYSKYRKCPEEAKNLIKTTLN